MNDSHNDLNPPTLEEKIEYVKQKKIELVKNQMWEQAASLRDVEKKLQQELEDKEIEKRIVAFLEEKIDKILKEKMSQPKTVLPPTVPVYFFPSIEDIRIGYECEKVGKDGNWEKIVVNQNHFIDDILALVETKNVRVPLLTKDQIIAEGWFYRSPSESVYRYWKGTKARANYAEGILSIFLVGGQATPIFKAKCKDINTFRLICKILDI